MQRRKKSSRKGFIPAILAGLAGVNLVSQLGKSLMNRKSGIKSLKRRKGYGLGQTVTLGQARRKTRKGLSLDMAKRGIKPPRGLVGLSRKGRSMPKRNSNFDRNKGLVAKKIIKHHLVGRKGRYNRRRGDVDADFLSNFGQDVFNPEPTVSKTWSRKAYEALRDVWGSKKAKEIKDKLAKSGEKALIDKIDKLSSTKAQKIASKIIDGKPIPKVYQKDLIPKNRFTGKYIG